MQGCVYKLLHWLQSRDGNMPCARSPNCPDAHHMPGTLTELIKSLTLHYDELQATHAFAPAAGV